MPEYLSIQPVASFCYIKSLSCVLWPEHELPFPAIKSKVNQPLLKCLIQLHHVLSFYQQLLYRHEEFLHRPVFYEFDVILVLQDAANRIPNNVFSYIPGIE